MNVEAADPDRGDTVLMNTTGAALTAADRCDRCHAQAYASATMPGGLVLLFCAHHWREHGPKVREVATAVTDETAALTG